MSWFERKLITILSVILGLLCVAILLVLSMHYRKAQNADKEYSVAVEMADAAKSAYTSISYRHDKILLSFALNESGKWYWVSDPDFP